MTEFFYFIKNLYVLIYIMFNFPKIPSTDQSKSDPEPEKLILLSTCVLLSLRDGTAGHCGCTLVRDEGVLRRFVLVNFFC